MATIDQARRAWKQTEGKFSKKTPIRFAYMGNGLGNAASNVIVPGQPNKVYARDSLNNKNYYIIQNRTVQPAIDKPIVIGYLQHEPDVEQVLDFHYSGYEYNDSSSAYNAGVNHGGTHQFGGGDEVFIDSRLFLPGLMHPTDPNSMRVYVMPFTYFYKEWNRFPGGSSPDLTSYIPASGSRYVTIALDPELNELVVRPGGVYTDVGGGAFQDIAGGFDAVPPPAGNEYPLGAVNLSDTAVVIEWSDTNNDVFDARLHISPALKEINDRINALELGLGWQDALTTTGATTDSAAIFKTNAALLQNTPVSTTGPTDGQSLVYHQSSNSWAPSTITGSSGGSGETNTAENLGSGIGVFREKTGVNLLFKSLSPGNYITLASGASEITIGSEGQPNIAESIGGGISLFKEKSGASLLFRSFLNTGANIEIGSAASTIKIATHNVVTSAINLYPVSETSTLHPINFGKSGSTISFRSLSAGTNISLSSTQTTITISANAASGAAGALTSATNLGSGIPIFREISASTLLFRSLSAGVNIDIKQAASTINISPPERHFNTLIQAPFVRNSASSWNNLTIPIWQAPKASGIEFNQFNISIMGDAAASLAFSLEKRDWGLLSSGGTSMLSTSQNATAGGIEITSFSDNASILVPKQYLALITGSGAASGGDLDFLSITGYYNFTNASPAITGTQYLLLEFGDNILLENSDILQKENL